MIKIRATPTEGWNRKIFDIALWPKIVDFVKMKTIFKINKLIEHTQLTKKKKM